MTLPKFVSVEWNVVNADWHWLDRLYISKCERIQFSMTFFQWFSTQRLGLTLAFNIHHTFWCFFSRPTQQRQTFCITLVQRRPNVFDIGPTLYKCDTHVCVCWKMAWHIMFYKCPARFPKPMIKYTGWVNETIENIQTGFKQLNQD